jgi:hypothetical protein
LRLVVPRKQNAQPQTQQHSTTAFERNETGGSSQHSPLPTPRLSRSQGRADDDEVPHGGGATDAKQSTSDRRSSSKRDDVEDVGFGLPVVKDAAGRIHRAAQDGTEELLRSLNSVQSPTPSPKAADGPAPPGARPDTAKPRAPTPPAIPRAPSPHLSTLTVPCPYAVMGCDASHSGPSAAGDPLMQPAVMAKHLALVSTTVHTLQARHDALELQVEALKLQEAKRARQQNDTSLSMSRSRLSVSRGALNTSLASGRSNRTPTTTPVGLTPQGGRALSASTSSRVHAPPPTSARPSTTKSPAPVADRSKTLTPRGSSSQPVPQAAPKPTRPLPPSSQQGRTLQPLAAWKAPPPASNSDPRGSDSGPLTPPAAAAASAAEAKARPKPNAATVRTAARELLQQRQSGGQGAIAYKELVSVSPGRRLPKLNTEALVSQPPPSTGEEKTGI